MEFVACVEEFILIIAEIFGIHPLWAALLIGGVVVGLVVGVVGRVLFQCRLWNTQAAAADRPQTATTSKTPRQVVHDSNAAKMKKLGCQLVLLIIAAIVMLAALGLLDEMASLIQQAIGATR